MEVEVEGNVKRRPPRGDGGFHVKLEETLKNAGLWSDDIQLPRSYAKYGDLVLFSANDFEHENWKKAGDLPWKVVCETLKVARVAQRRGPIQGERRLPNVELLYGRDDTVVRKKENGIIYSWDLRKCMFSDGNVTEKLRIANFDCSGEVVVDLYAGIGYFTLPYLVHAKADRVYAVDINPDSIYYLKENLRLNKVEEKCVVIFGDNAMVAPKNVADRVNLGLIPSSEPSWPMACAALKQRSGGILHIHHVLDVLDPALGKPSQDSKPLSSWSGSVTRRIKEMFGEVYGYGIREEWFVEVTKVTRVKSYGSWLEHIVADVECRPPSYFIKKEQGNLEPKLELVGIESKAESEIKTEGTE